MHDDYPGRTGWMLFTNSYYDGFGANAAYVRTNRTGNIIPVNAASKRDDFVVTWYERDRLGVAWPNFPGEIWIALADERPTLGGCQQSWFWPD
ncbi:MAG: hypothetical protein WDM76_10325 [Limisphaerales bacterium]